MKMQISDSKNSTNRKNRPKKISMNRLAELKQSTDQSSNHSNNNNNTYSPRNQNDDAYRVAVSQNNDSEVLDRALSLVDERSEMISVKFNSKQ